MKRLRYLLLQSRDATDPMGPQEVRCFARSLGCEPSDIQVVRLLGEAPTRAVLQQFDMLLLGGSGQYSAATAVVTSEPGRPRPRVEWIDRALDVLREIHDLAIPTFASCWGFQAMARAMGGECVNDLPNAELGNVELTLTAAGRDDPVFSTLPERFTAHAGHEDRVVKLPRDAVLLASSKLVAEQAFRFEGRPIYCTQFHPELNRAAILERVVAYPSYVERIARTTYEEFIRGVEETLEANGLLRRFREVTFG
jgi:GMP synthase (glutamine-hydrolysing)